MMNISGISGKGLTVKFGSVSALNDCSVSLPGRGLVSVIGENGSGKSTLLDVLSGFVSISKGCLTDGFEMPLTRSQLIRAAARVYQRVVLPDGLRVYEYMAICARPQMASSPFTPKTFFGRSQSSSNDTLGKLVTLAGVDSTRCVEQLSWGQQRIVSIGGALMTAKPVILLDEPFAGIVNSLGVALMDILKDEASRRLVVFVEHDLTYAVRADRLVVLKQGRVAGDFSHGEILESSLMQYFGD